MKIQIKFATFLFIFTQIFLLQSIFAQNTLNTTEQSALAQDVENSSVATTGDAIQQFVKADFSQRRGMLNQWPASIDPAIIKSHEPSESRSTCSRMCLDAWFSRDVYSDSSRFWCDFP